jgi:hypothetical protein
MQDFNSIYQLTISSFSNSKNYNDNNSIINNNISINNFSSNKLKDLCNLKFMNTNTNKIYNKTNINIPKIIERLNNSKDNNIYSNNNIFNNNNNITIKEKNLFSSRNLQKRKNLFFDDVKNSPKKKLISEILNSNS